MKIRGNKLLIELDHFTTEEDVRIVKLSIINVLQEQFSGEVNMDSGQRLANYILLEMLKDLENG